jgi:hypothetical protein
MAAQPWICGACRSINQPREGRCYRCRTPRELVEADPTTLIVAGAGRTTAEEPRPTGSYRSSGEAAFLAQVLIGAALVVAVIGNVMRADIVSRVLEGEAVAGDADTGVVAIVGGLGLAVGAAALVTFALWLSRIVANVPSVGLGWPNVTPSAAIFESIIPGVNLYRVPAILRDVIHRIEPDGRGEALIAATWLALVGGVFLPRVPSFAAVFVIGDPEGLIPLRILAGQLGLGLTVAGGILLIVLIQWLETRMDRLAAAKAAEVAGSPSASTPDGRAG